MYNPASGVIFRIAKQDHKLGDLNVKKGTYVTPSFYAQQLYNFKLVTILKFLLNHLNLNQKDGWTRIF